MHCSSSSGKNGACKAKCDICKRMLHCVLGQPAAYNCCDYSWMARDIKHKLDEAF